MAAIVRVEDLILVRQDPTPKQLAQKFWGMVLLMAIRDSASSVHYHSWKGDGALAYIVGNVRLEMRPPPADWSRWFVGAARFLLTQRRSLLGRVFAKRANPRCGSLILCLGDEHEIEWEVVCWSSGERMGVEFLRVTPLDEQTATAAFRDADPDRELRGHRFG